MTPTYRIEWMRDDPCDYSGRGGSQRIVKQWIIDHDPTIVMLERAVDRGREWLV